MRLCSLLLIVQVGVSVLLQSCLSLHYANIATQDGRHLYQQNETFEILCNVGDASSWQMRKLPLQSMNALSPTKDDSVFLFDHRLEIPDDLLKQLPIGHFVIGVINLNSTAAIKLVVTRPLVEDEGMYYCQFTPSQDVDNSSEVQILTEKRHSRNMIEQSALFKVIRIQYSAYIDRVEFGNKSDVDHWTILELHKTTVVVIPKQESVSLSVYIVEGSPPTQAAVSLKCPYQVKPISFVDIEQKVVSGKLVDSFKVSLSLQHWIIWLDQKLIFHREEIVCQLQLGENPASTLHMRAMLEGLEPSLDCGSSEVFAELGRRHFFFTCQARFDNYYNIEAVYTKSKNASKLSDTENSGVLRLDPPTRTVSLYIMEVSEGDYGLYSLHLGSRLGVAQFTVYFGPKAQFGQLSLMAAFQNGESKHVENLYGYGEQYTLSFSLMILAAVIEFVLL